MDESEALHLGNPGDKQAEATARAARRAYARPPGHVADLEFAATLPTAVPVRAETFTAV